MRRWSAGAIVGALVTLVACAELFDAPTQCRTDADCERFAAVCDVAQGVCVPPVEDDKRPERPVPSQPTQDASPDGFEIDERCAVDPKPTEVIGTKLEAGARSEITTSVTLGCDKDWVLDTLLFVRSGATLTIAPGTTIRAKKGVGAAIVVNPGGRIVAEGKRDAPIVITSESPTPAPGDWRGVYVLGLAPPSGQGPYEDDPDLVWGGTSEMDDSGVLSFVRIEYARSGLVLAGVGKRTKVDFVQVRRPVESCFMFYGGRVDAKHLVCQSPGDDQFEWYLGYSGRAQFIYGQKAAPPPVYDSNGLVIDAAHPVIYNATICGDAPTALFGYGVVYRDRGTLDLNGAIVSGWFSGLDARGYLPDRGGVRASIFFGNATNPAYAETPAETNPDLPTYDDDNGIDELADFANAMPPNSTADPKLVDCFDAKNPKPWPTTPLTTNAPSPPDDGFFDPNAKYIGAFEDANDGWMTGAWVRFD